MAREEPGQTLQATALVHEAYVRLVDVEKARHWNSRGHFYSAAAEAMRRILVDRARHKNTLRAGGDAERVEFDRVEPAREPPTIDLLALNEALEELQRHDTRKAELVKLRYFAGLSVKDAAATLDIATSTAIADWAYAKGWLRLRMSGSSDT
jgi:RNA polymerase sigma factor (TIGR02999 family)